jgi:hypothetical protein
MTELLELDVTAVPGCTIEFWCTVLDAVSAHYTRGHTHRDRPAVHRLNDIPFSERGTIKLVPRGGIRRMVGGHGTDGATSFRPG